MSSQVSLFAAMAGETLLVDTLDLVHNQRKGIIHSFAHKCGNDICAITAARLPSGLEKRRF